ncbi:MAG TPA: GPI anchored serine-threonine rich family protein [Cyclobacteriaceae bacterium]
MKKIIICLLISTASMSLKAQEFIITRFELAGDKLLVYYDLIDTVKNRHYTVRVYSSKDNFLNPVQKLSGDAGLEVAPGKNKKITWNAKEELGAEFAGRIAIEIRGRLYVPFVRFGSFEDYKVMKRGVPFTITWTGGTRQNVLNFDLYNKSNTKVWTQAGVGNTGNYEITIPTNVKPGKGYRFRISDSKNKDDIVYTGEFAVKRRVPLLVKIIPVVALAGVGYVIFSGKDDPAGTEDIVNPPCPGGENCNE